LFLIFWMSLSKRPSTSICTGDSGFEQSIHHFAAR
jgi:hypothetical protein